MYKINQISSHGVQDKQDFHDFLTRCTRETRHFQTTNTKMNNNFVVDCRVRQNRPVWKGGNALEYLLPLDAVKKYIYSEKKNQLQNILMYFKATQMKSKTCKMNILIYTNTNDTQKNGPANFYPCKHLK